MPHAVPRLSRKAVSLTPILSQPSPDLSIADLSSSIQRKCEPCEEMEWVRVGINHGVGEKANRLAQEAPLEQVNVRAPGIVKELRISAGPASVCGARGVVLSEEPRPFAATREVMAHREPADTCSRTTVAAC